MRFIYYDVALLVLFAIIAGTLLYKNRANLKREGLLALYRTQLGIKIIDYIGRKYKKSIKVLSYISIATGYLLMIGVVYLLIYVFIKYVKNSVFIVSQIKLPPISPILPYFDKFLPGFPPLYFIYFILIIAIIAIPHELAHGIFMKRYNIKIKSTGFGFFPWFFPVFPAAFVEQDEKSMVKATKFGQMAVLSAGTFANLLTGIFFAIITVFMFSCCFSPIGVGFSDYAFNITEISAITMINGIKLDNPDLKTLIELTNQSEKNEIIAHDIRYISVRDYDSDGKYVILNYDAPAIRNNLTGYISEIDGIKITSGEKLLGELGNKNPGDIVNIKTINQEGQLQEYEIELDFHPKEKERAFLGIGSSGKPPIIEDHLSIIPFIGEKDVYYKTEKGIYLFIFSFLEWLVLVCFAVALINMVPMGIFDGGRFFYLTIFGIIKNEKIARKAFAGMTIFFLMMFLILMLVWFFALIR